MAQTAPAPTTGAQTRHAPARIRRHFEAAGIGLDGRRPWDLQVHDPALYGDLIRRGSLALGEGYVQGRWDCDQLDGLFTRLLQQDNSQHAVLGLDATAPLRRRIQALGDSVLNRQSTRRAHQVGRRHYDVDPRVYTAMLDGRRIYSCGYWHQAQTLEEAQEHKLRLICEKLELAPGLRLLDLGCGWGGLARFAAEHYGVSVLGVTVSQQQAEACQILSQGLSVDVHLADYRSALIREQGPFDRVVSVGMLEHVGRHNDRTLFAVMDAVLRDDGLCLLQTIGSAETCDWFDPWIDTYVFPNGRLPSAMQLCQGWEPWFVLEDWDNFGADYDRTLMAWCANFERAWPDLAPHLEPEFQRMWRYYLLSCAGLFRSRRGQLWQIVLSKRNRSQLYRSMRARTCLLESQKANPDPNSAATPHVYGGDLTTR
jgi:cyclopropane-fatty-acyl-phospholipid synthase